MKPSFILFGLILIMPMNLGFAQDPKPAPGGDQPQPPVVRPDNPPAPQPPAPPAPPERRRGRGGLLERFDRNGDGVIDKSELEGAGRIGRRIGGADTNGDGIITREELDGLLGGGQQGGGSGDEGEGERPRRRGGADRVKELIGRLDRNGNGVIDKDELPEGWGERLGPADSNGDGIITPEELEGLMGGRGRPEGEGRPRPEGEEGERPRRREGPGAQELIERFDRNGNGVIDLDELDEGMLERFKPLDANGDGVIDESEINRRRRGGRQGGGNGPGGNGPGGNGQGGDGEEERPRRRDGRGGQGVIERLDRNGNGVIDLDELDEGMLERLKPLDANGDGVIDESEITRRRRGGRQGGGNGPGGNGPGGNGPGGNGPGGNGPGGNGGVGEEDAPRPERGRGRPQREGDRPKPGVRPLPL